MSLSTDYAVVLNIVQIRWGSNAFQTMLKDFIICREGHSSLNILTWHSLLWFNIHVSQHLNWKYSSPWRSSRRLWKHFGGFQECCWQVSCFPSWWFKDIGHCKYFDGTYEACPTNQGSRDAWAWRPPLPGWAGGCGPRSGPDLELRAVE